jgi:hypothetical protein
MIYSCKQVAILSKNDLFYHYSVIKYKISYRFLSFVSLIEILLTSTKIHLSLLQIQLFIFKE